MPSSALPAVLSTAIAMALATAPAASQAQTLVYGTNFEAPTFNVGPVGDAYLAPNSGQDGWRSSPREPYSAAPSPWVSISTQRAYSGTQSLQLRMDTSFYNGVNGNGAAAWRDYSSTPLVLHSQTDPFSMSMRLYLDQAPTSDLGWAVSLTTGVTGLGLQLTPDNKVIYGHSLMNQGATYTPGFDLHNSWLQLVVERNPDDWTSLRLTIANGSQTWQQVVSSPGGSMVTAGIGGVIPTFPVAAYGTAYVDDFRIGYSLGAVPEPGTWALWMAGLTVAVGRRRLMRARVAG